MVHIPLLIFSFSYLRTSLLPQNNSCTYQRVSLYLTVSVVFFWPCVAIIIAATIKEDCSYRNNCGIRLHDGDLEHSLMKEKNRSSYVFLPIFMFCHSRFGFRNLEDANLSMLLWCITTSSLSISSWHDIRVLTRSSGLPFNGIFPIVS